MADDPSNSGVALNQRPDGVMLPVKARAGGRRNAVTGVQDGRLQVSVTQAAEKGKANAAIGKLLGRALGVRPADIVLISGGASPLKQFLLAGADLEAVRQSVAECVSAASR